MALVDSVQTTPRIAIAGGTGRVGSVLARNLMQDSVRVRVLTRDPDSSKVPSGVDAVRIDFSDPSSLAVALRGVDRLFIALGSSPQQAAQEIALLDAAVAEGVGHNVKVSAIGTPLKRHPFDWHMEVEAHLAALPVGYTVLRPSAFNDLLSRSARNIAEGTWGGFVGDGKTNFIDVRDVADVARTVLLADIAPLTQQVFHLTGPRSWTNGEIAELLTSLLGRAVTYQSRSKDEQRALLLKAGLSDFVCDLLIGLEQTLADSVLGETTSTVKELTGNQPRALEDWLREQIVAFRG